MYLAYQILITAAFCVLPSSGVVCVTGTLQGSHALMDQTDQRYSVVLL